MHIDNLQGVMNINTSNSNVNIGNIENGLFHIDANNSLVEMTINSLHDTSLINCKKLKLFMSEEARDTVNIVKMNGD